MELINEINRLLDDKEQPAATCAAQEWKTLGKII